MSHENFNNSGGNWSSDTINELAINKRAKIEDLDQRVFTLTAATGLGKTLSSINFALILRKRIQKREGFFPRIIYVAPFISILDQNMDVLQNIFNMKSQSALLLMHHHLAPVHFTKDFVEEQKGEAYSTSQSELMIQG